MPTRRCVCSYCPTVIIDGEPPTVFGLCIPCGERIDRERKAERWAMYRKHMRDPKRAKPLTEDEAEELFEGIDQGE